MSDWVELRVHGVSGTPPDYMLGSAHTVQVAGDDRSRCFRPADSLGRELRAPDGHVLEAFHWGRWTSGSWTQGLWLLLIPFGILNAAHYTLPAAVAGPARLARALAAAVLRLVAVIVTGLFALATCLVVVDLAAWQWLVGRGPVPGWLVVDAALAGAALLIAGLSRLGAVRSGRRFRFAAAGACDLGPGEGLADAAFFDGDPDSPALRLLHRAAGLLVVAWLGASVAVEAGVRWAGPLRVAVSVLLGLVGAAVLVTGRSPAATPLRWSARAGRAVRLLGVLAVAASLVAVAGADVDGAGALPGTGAAVGVLVLAGFLGMGLLVAAVTGLAVATTRPGGGRGRAQPGQPPGAGGPALAAPGGARARPVGHLRLPAAQPVRPRLPAPRDGGPAARRGNGVPLDQPLPRHRPRRRPRHQLGPQLRRGGADLAPARRPRRGPAGRAGPGHRPPGLRDEVAAARPRAGRSGAADPRRSPRRRARRLLDRPRLAGGARRRPGCRRAPVPVPRTGGARPVGNRPGAPVGHQDRR